MTSISFHTVESFIYRFSNPFAPVVPVLQTAMQSVVDVLREADGNLLHHESEYESVDVIPCPMGRVPSSQDSNLACASTLPDVAGALKAGSQGATTEEEADR